MAQSETAALDPTARFGTRVADYIRFRPRYPAALIEGLATHCGLAPGRMVVDLGAGTGILTEDLLEFGARVQAVEPNGPMREASVALLGAHEGFSAHDGRAESMPLAEGAADLLVAAQAFHWFEVEAAARECARVLRAEGYVGLIWNTRRLEGTPFLVDYEAFARTHGRDYAQVSERYADPAALDRFFDDRGWSRASHPNAQALDREGLLGRLASCSYMPSLGDPDYPSMREAAYAMFDAHAEAGPEGPCVRLIYDTELYWGRPRA